MAEGETQDPTPGVLRVEETFGGVTYFRGEADLTPKHRVVIDFAHEGGPVVGGLAVARAAFERVRRDEIALRIAAAGAYLDGVYDVDYHFGEPGWNAERV